MNWLLIGEALQKQGFLFLQTLPYLNSVQLQNIQHPTHNKIFDYVFAPNAVTPSSRINLKLNNTY